MAESHARNDERLARYEAEAAAGDPQAFFALGLIYATGRMVEADPVAAHMWFNLAALHGHAEAAEERRLLAEELSPAEIARAQRLAREWLEAHRSAPEAMARAA